MPNGPAPSPPAGIPPWVSYAVYVVSTLGVSTLFAMLLLWFTLTRFDRTVEVIEAHEAARTKLLTQIGENFVTAIERQGDRFDRATHENIRANRELVGILLRREPPAPAYPPPPPPMDEPPPSGR